MKYGRFSPMSLVSAAATGALAVFGLAFLTFSEEEKPISQQTASESSAEVKEAVSAPSIESISSDTISEEIEPVEQLPSSSVVPPHDVELTLTDAISAFATAVAEDNSSLSTKELVHLDALFENLSHHASQENAK